MKIRSPLDLMSGRPHKAAASLLSQSHRVILNKFIRDRRGVTALATGISFFVLAGFAGTAIDVSAWLGAKTSVQNAADQAVYSAVVGVNAGGSGYTNAFAILAQSGYACTSTPTPNAAGSASCTLTGGGTVSVNSPPAKGSFTGDSTAWEVTVAKPQQLWLSRVILDSAPTVKGRAVGLEGGNICILALDNRSNDIHSIFGGNNANVTVGGNCQVADNLKNNKDGDSVDVKSGAVLNFNSLYMTVATKCDGSYPGSCQGTLTTTNPILVSQPAIIDPYAKRTLPAATGTCDHTNLVINTSTTLNPGFYCSTTNAAAITVTPLSLKTSTNGGPGGTLVLTMTTAPSSVSVGMTVSDTTTTTAITSGTTVTAVNVAAKTVTLSQKAKTKSNDFLSFTPAGGMTVTLNAGVYILDGQGGASCTGAKKPSACLSGDLIIDGNATVTGSGVSIVLTTSKAVGIDVGNVNITNGGVLSLTAPTANVSGYQVQGIALWQDKLAPNPTSTDGNQYTASSDGVNTISSGGATNITGLVYFPSEGIFYTGGSGGNVCTQIVAFTVVFQESSQWNYPSNCASAAGELPIGGTPQLVE